MKLIFRRSDALAMAHDEVEDQEIITEDDVQLTYNVLRDARTSNPIATCIDGDWYIESGRYDGIDDLGPYSDIIITKEN